MTGLVNPHYVKVQYYPSFGSRQRSPRTEQVKLDCYVVPIEPTELPDPLARHFLNIVV